MFSIYSSWFSVEAAGFAWRDTLTNWFQFLGKSDEIVIAVNTSTDDTPRLVREFFAEYAKKNYTSTVQTKVIDIAIPYDDPEFDGKGKAAALSHCTQPFCILLDCDEVIVPNSRRAWVNFANQLGNAENLDALMIPVLDLFHSEKHYKCGGQNLGTKWYLHKNNPNLTRGVVKWAYRENGSIDITKSDTCELITKDSRDLARSAQIFLPSNHYTQSNQLQSGDIPFVYHLGFLIKEQRVKQDAFWEKHWQNRDKSDVKTAKTKEELDKTHFFPHYLPSWKTL